MAGYTRQDTTGQLANGNPIDADIFNNEYDAIEGAFNAGSGHSHDGSVGGGAPIEDVGPSQELKVDSSAVFPKTDNVIDSGKAALRWRNGYFGTNLSVGVDATIDNDATIGNNATIGNDASVGNDLTVTNNASVGNDLTVTGNTVLNGNVDIGDASSDTVTITAYVDSAVIPSATGTYDLGTSGLEWNDIFIDGTATVDMLQVDEDAAVTGDMAVTGDTTLTGSLDVGGGNMTLDASGNMTIAGTLDVTGATGIDGNFDVGDTLFTVDATTGNTVIAGTLDVTGDTTVENLTVNGITTLGDAGGDAILFNGTVASNFTPNITATYNLGTPSNIWSNVYTDNITVSTDINVGGDLVVTGDLTVQGTTTTVNSTTVDIADLNITLASNATTAAAANGGGITVAGAAATMTYDATNDRWVMNKNLEVPNVLANVLASNGATILSPGNGIDAAVFIGDVTGNIKATDGSVVFTCGDGSTQATFDGVVGGTNPAEVTGTTIQFDTGLTDGTITIDGFVDEDDMVSDSATKVPTQQSVKAYVDAAVAGDGTGTIDASSVDATDLSVTTSGGLDFNGGAATGWVVAQNSVTNDLEFIYNGVVQFKMTSTGTLNANDDIVAAAF